MYHLLYDQRKKKIIFSQNVQGATKIAVTVISIIATGIMYLQTGLIIFMIYLRHIKLYDFQPLNYTTVKCQWSYVNFVPILETAIDTDIVVRNSGSRSMVECVLKCFFTYSYPSIFYESGNQMCHCNDQKMSSLTSFAGSGLTYAEKIEFYQVFPDTSEVELPLYRDCKELHDGGTIINGVYSVSPDGGDPFQVYCDMDGGGWTVFQRREDGSVDFYLGWNSYKEGFGDLMGEHWLGLDFLNRLVQDPSELCIELETFDNFAGQRTGYANYSSFYIEDESNLYRLTVIGFTGNAGDSLISSKGQNFTTKDKDNDPYSTNCAMEYKGAWWYQTCHQSNLNGLYLAGPTTTYADGVVWATGWGYEYSLKTTVMKTRRK